MGENHFTPTTPDAVVVSCCPDYCKSPVKVVPYDIVSFFDDSILYVDNVRINGFNVTNMESRIAGGYGNEEGVGGGVKSGVYSKSGYSRPTADPAMTVNARGCRMLIHHTKFDMNCAGPEGAANTTGKAVYALGTGGSTTFDEDGCVCGDACPDVESDAPAAGSSPSKGEAGDASATPEASSEPEAPEPEAPEPQAGSPPPDEEARPLEDPAGSDLENAEEDKPPSEGQLVEVPEGTDLGEPELVCIERLIKPGAGDEDGWFGYDPDLNALDQLWGFFRGGGRSLWGTAKFFGWDLPGGLLSFGGNQLIGRGVDGAWELFTGSPLDGYWVSAAQADEQLEMLAGLWNMISQDPGGVLWDAFTSPIKEMMQQGRYGEAWGLAYGEVLQAIVGPKGAQNLKLLTWLNKAGALGKLGLGKLDDIFKGFDAMSRFKSGAFLRGWTDELLKGADGVGKLEDVVRAFKDAGKLDELIATGQLTDERLATLKGVLSKDEIARAKKANKAYAAQRAALAKQYGAFYDGGHIGMGAGRAPGSPGGSWTYRGAGNDAAYHAASAEGKKAWREGLRSLPHKAYQEFKDVTDKADWLMKRYSGVTGKFRRLASDPLSMFSIVPRDVTSLAGWRPRGTIWWSGPDAQSRLGMMYYYAAAQSTAILVPAGISVDGEVETTCFYKYTE